MKKRGERRVAEKRGKQKTPPVNIPLFAPEQEKIVKRVGKFSPEARAERLEKKDEKEIKIPGAENLSPEAREALKQLRSAERLLKAKEARDDLIKFGELMMPDVADPDNPNISRYKAQYFHKAIAAALQEVEKSNIRKLILTIPPRHGKSQLASRFFPAWFVGRDPYRHMIFATYNDTFAEDFGRDVRNLMQSTSYSLVFPEAQLEQGNASSNRLKTIDGGLLVFVGRGGSSTGRGGDLLLIDDPFKDRREAESPTIRNEVWSWFNDTMSTRLMSDTGCIIIIMTRWHEDDLVGRLTDPENEHFNAEEAEQWKIINIKAIADETDPIGRKPGQPLWPDRFGIEYLTSIKNRNPKGFSALYQQEPNPEDGEFFTKDMILGYRPEDLPKTLRIYAASDHAVSTKQTSDATVLMVVGVDDKDDIWVLDCWWKRKSTDVVVEAMIDLMEKKRPLIWWAASDHISKSIGPFLYKRMRERGVYINVSESSEKGDKMQKAQAIQGRMSMGKVHLPKSAPWFSDAVAELLKFPNGKHDDFVDALSHIGRGLTRQVKARVRTEQQTTVAKAPVVGTMGWIKKDSAFRHRRTIIQNSLRGF